MMFVYPLLFVPLIFLISVQICLVCLIIRLVDLVNTARETIAIGPSAQVPSLFIVKMAPVYLTREIARISENVQRTNLMNASMGDVPDRLYSVCITLLLIWSWFMFRSPLNIQLLPRLLVPWEKLLPIFCFGGVKKRAKRKKVPILLLCVQMESYKIMNIVQ